MWEIRCSQAPSRRSPQRLCLTLIVATYEPPPAVPADPENAAKHAQLAVDAAWNVDHVRLDYSPQSLAEVDRIVLPFPHSFREASFWILSRHGNRPGACSRQVFFSNPLTGPFPCANVLSLLSAGLALAQPTRG
ncbi:MAG: hypothetical protein C5B50_01415 [Verrucomicrobia bacterium]|nr:MAG: hypothetical protein C5B50_01415 [Verrucomicrobiota bacterium]